MIGRGSEGVLTGVGGLRLAYRAWEVPSARAALVLVHGIGDHSGRYAAFAERMASCGMSTYALDLRGHGLSDGRRGHVPAFDVYLQEVDRFRREVEGLADVHVPLFLVGQSMGGLIALRYQQEYNTRFRGAVIVSPWLATAMAVPRWKVMASSLASRVLPSLPFRTGIDPANISRDPEIVEAYRADPLVHDRITPRLFTEASSAMGMAFQRSDRLDEPMLFLLAGADRIVDTERSVRFARQLRGDTTVQVVDGAYHDLLNEQAGTAVLRQVRDWVAARL